MNVQLSDLVTVGLLVVLEGLLSADNALVVAVMILGLPRTEQKLALRYGLLGAFAFRIVATLLAVYLIRLAWVKLLGGLYLVYLTYNHFFESGDAQQRSRPRPARPWMGLSALWGTILKVELVNIAFSVDSILVAVAMSRKTWVVLAGGLIGIVAMRVVIAQLLAIVPLPDPGGRRVCDHRARRLEAAARIRECDGMDSLRSAAMVVAGSDRGDVPGRLRDGAAQRTGRDGRRGITHH